MAAAAAAADEARLDSFLQWLQANSADLRSCTIRACGGGGKGFGVFSTAAPEAGATDEHSQDSCSHCHEIDLRREDLGSCSFSTPLASWRIRELQHRRWPCLLPGHGGACSPTFACRLSPPCSTSGFSFGEACKSCGAAFLPPPVASMPSFSFFCAHECDEPEQSVSSGDHNVPGEATVAAAPFLSPGGDDDLKDAEREHFAASTGGGTTHRAGDARSFRRRTPLRASLVFLVVVVFGSCLCQ